ncbi:cupin domain-containing protein [Hyphomicrobium sp.]|uniref:cupin domain-containing protein n=1 Tax=Hyphomicrobium sp. TaxID=82 RepID=UPI002E363440|nr:cupin domain-containing protein [Hyphomicrobium sp.]HEX2841148.1 cupin domain-containing protein [Hyphomicrobium sp.]
MSGFVRLSADGDGQLEDWGRMPSDELIAGTGQQYGHLWLDDAYTGLLVGVWACSPMTGRMGPWSTNEVMLLLEGSVTIDHADGSSLDVKAGEAFFIPKGTVCSWRQEGDLKKFFVIHSDSSGLASENPAALRAQKIDGALPFAPAQGPDAALLEGPAPVCREATAFTDLTGRLTTGLWSASPYRRQAIAFPHHELMHIIEGAVTLSDDKGREETFVAGDTCFVPKGATVGWASTAPVLKLFASFTPSV